MATRSQDVEILVHVNAPSRITSDAAYRQLAQAYLSFEPGLRSDVLDQGDIHAQPPPSSSAAASSSQEESAHSSQPILIDSQDLSFQSALDNRASPRLPTGPLHHPVPADSVPASLPEHDGSQNSWCAPPSQISDSYPMPSASIPFLPTRILERFVSRPFSSPPEDSSLPPSAHVRGEIPREDRSSLEHPESPSSLPSSSPEQEQHHRSGCVDATKVVPVTPLVPPAVKRPSEAQNPHEENTGWDVTHISGSDLSVPPQATPSWRAESEPPPVKRAKTGNAPPTAPGKDPKTLTRSASDTVAATARPRSTPDLRQLKTLEIRTPSPPVGTETIRPASLISEKLAKLAADLSSRYRPDAARDIQPLERGYWLVDCSPWSADTRADAWAFLASYLSSGLAGWGVWCRRDPAHSWIRLYCWGHIVKHTYLLLYLASGRQLKLTGAEWRGGDGEVALRVPPHEKQQS